MKTNISLVKTLEFKVAGTRFYVDLNAAGSDLPMPFDSGEKLVLVKEPENIYDSKAILVYDKTNQFKLGHIERDKNEEIYEYLDSNKYSYKCIVTEDLSLIEYSDLEASFYDIRAIVEFHSQS